MAVNIEVKANRGESSESLIKRFLKKVKKQEIIKEYLEKVSFHRTKSEKKKYKKMKNQYLKKKGNRRY